MDDFPEVRSSTIMPIFDERDRFIGMLPPTTEDNLEEVRTGEPLDDITNISEEEWYSILIGE